jgi:hypothetical protein
MSRKAGMSGDVAAFGVCALPSGKRAAALARLRALGYETEERTRLNAALRLRAGGADRIGVTGNAHGNQA